MSAPRRKTVLGISLEDGHITTTVVRFDGSRLHVKHVAQAPLSLDPLRNDPELVGREIRNALASAGIRERRCVVCAPLDWVLTLRTDLPDLSPDDEKTFLNVQAEREFPFPLEGLSVSSSKYGADAGGRMATVVAIPTSQLLTLQSVLKAAKLNVVSITLGVTSLFTSKRDSEGALVLLVRRNGLDVQVRAGGGIVALRCLGEAVERVSKGAAPNVDAVVRELRVTLAQIPSELRSTVKKVCVYGAADLRDPLLNALGEPVAKLGLTLDSGTLASKEHALETDSTKNIYPAPLAAAAGYALGISPEFEFLPPKESYLKRLTANASSGVTRWLASAAVIIALLVGTAFIVQYWRLGQLESKWRSIEPKVAELSSLQDKVRQLRPWYDDSIQSLVIVRKLTEAFPEEGVVWAKSLKIENLNSVSCAGNSKSNQEWMNVLDKLRASAGVEDLQFQQVRGDSPLQFGLSFRWKTEGEHGN